MNASKVAPATCGLDLSCDIHAADTRRRNLPNLFLYQVFVLFISLLLFISDKVRLSMKNISER